MGDEGVHGAHRRAVLVRRHGRRYVDNAVTAGLLRPLWTGVVVDGHRVHDVRTRAAAALLATAREAVICGSTAAVLHGCTAITDPDVHVLVPYFRAPRRRPGLVVHHSCRYADQVVELDGLRTLNLEQAVADLLCTASPADALAVGDEALRAAGARHEDLRRAVVRRLRVRPDPRGTVRGAFLWDLASPRAESAPESWIRILIIQHGFPLPEVNFALLSPGGREIYRLDLAWPELRIALEYDGHAAHVGREEHDAAREDDLRHRGWIVVRARAADLVDPTRFMGELRAAFARRGYVW